MPSDRDTPEFRARAEVRSQRQQAREAQSTERERDEVARVAGIDEKTARLKALRLERDAGEAAAKKAAAKKASSKTTAVTKTKR